MNKEFIPYELAFDLRQIGFDEVCIMYYSDSLNGYTLQSTDYWYSNSHWMFNANDNKDRHLMCTAPLYQQAFRWFREKYGWVGGIRKLSSVGNNKIVGEFYKDDDNNFIMFGETYEECELRALKYLIELFKNK